jgi:cell division protein FtsW (lipid II flippase)
MKKKIIPYLLIALALIIYFWYFNIRNCGNNGYDISQSGTSKNTGQFIPENKTDYIFTTVEGETKVCGIIIFGLLISIVIFILIRKRLR